MGKQIVVLSLIVVALLQNGHGAKDARPSTRLLVPQETTSAENPSEKIEGQRFGYQLFSAGTAAAAAVGTATADYRLGPGDVLLVYLGGKVQLQQQVEVAADGRLFFPNVGVLPAAGLTIPQFKEQLDEKLRRVYTRYTLDVMLAAPKRISVAVVGEVAAPGTYVAGAFSSVLDLISLAKGPLPTASLRDVRIYRGDSLSASVDLYDFILRPKGADEPLLQTGDRVFVTVVSATVEVRGEVQRPAIYELNPHRPERLRDLFELAGGFTAYADRRHIELVRLLPGGERKLFALCAAEECDDDSNNPLLQDQDVVVVYSLLERVPQDSVEVYGEVRKPGAYPFRREMRVSDLLLAAGGFTRYAYTAEADAALFQPDGSMRTVKIDLQRALSGDDEADLLLGPRDRLFVRRTPGEPLGRMVQVLGEVRFPGFYPIVEDSTTLSDLIQAAGGFTDEALISEMKLVRERPAAVEDKEFLRLKEMSRGEMSDSEYEYFVMKQNTGEINEVVVDFYRLFVKKDASEDVLLKSGDVVHVPKRPQVVFVSGRVSNAGGVLYRQGADVRYYIQKAGGFTWDADSRRAKVIKANGEIRSMSGVKTLEAGDRIWVPRKKEVNYWQVFRDVVMVMGQMATVYLVVRTATR